MHFQTYVFELFRWRLWFVRQWPRFHNIKRFFFRSVTRGGGEAPFVTKEKSALVTLFAVLLYMYFSLSGGS